MNYSITEKMLSTTYIKTMRFSVSLSKWKAFLKACWVYHLNKASSWHVIVEIQNQINQNVLTSIFSKQLTLESLILSIDEWVLNINKKKVVHETKEKECKNTKCFNQWINFCYFGSFLKGIVLLHNQEPYMFCNLIYNLLNIFYFFISCLQKWLIAPAITFSIFDSLFKLYSFKCLIYHYKFLLFVVVFSIIFIVSH